MIIFVTSTESAPYCQVTTIQCPYCQFNNHIDVKNKPPIIDCDQCARILTLDYSQQTFSDPKIPHGTPLYTD